MRCAITISVRILSIFLVIAAVLRSCMTRTLSPILICLKLEIVVLLLIQVGLIIIAQIIVVFVARRIIPMIALGELLEIFLSVLLARLWTIWCVVALFGMLLVMIGHKLTE